MIIESEIGLASLKPESDAPIAEGDQVRVIATGLVFPVMGFTNVEGIQYVLVKEGTLVVQYLLTKVELAFGRGVIQGPDIEVNDLHVRADVGSLDITLSVSDDGDVFLESDFPVFPSEWLLLEDINNLKQLQFTGPVSQKVFLYWKKSGP